MNVIHLSYEIQNIYPRYSEEFLAVILEDYLEATEQYLGKTDRSQYGLTDSFTAQPLSEGERMRMLGQKVCAMSLFFKPVNYFHRKNRPAQDENGQILMSELEDRFHPIFKDTQRFGRNFLENYVDKILDSLFNDWIPVVFLARDLSCLITYLRERGCVVVNMKHSSIGHSPGVMWRYIAFNLPAQACYIQDTDRVFSHSRAEYLFKILADHPHVALARSLQWTSGSGEMPIILGNDFIVRPSMIDFNASSMMLAYIVLNILHEDRLTNFCHEPKRNRNDCMIVPMSRRSLRNDYAPLPNERVNGKCYPYYQFDEQWLKEFVYYHLSDGRMATLLHNSKKSEDLIQSLDLAFQRANGNLLV